MIWGTFGCWFALIADWFTSLCVVALVYCDLFDCSGVCLLFGLIRI